MKTIVLIMALIGFTAMNGYSQDKNCSCRKKTVHHHHIYHKRSVAKTGCAVKTHARHTTAMTQQNVPINKAIMNLGDNKVCVFNKNGMIEYGTSESYTGYYDEAHANCDIYDYLNPPYPDMNVTSSAFKNNGVIPAKYSCEGQGVNPPLNVTNIPPGTRSLAVVMFDPHATAQKSTTYWLMWDLDTTGIIPESFTTDHTSQNPESMQYGYQAVCPVGGSHYYHFRVYALNAKLVLGKHTTQAQLEAAIRGHVLAKGELVGEYNRHLD